MGERGGGRGGIFSSPTAERERDLVIEGLAGTFGAAGLFIGSIDLSFGGDVFGGGGIGGNVVLGSILLSTSGDFFAAIILVDVVC